MEEIISITKKEVQSKLNNALTDLLLEDKFKLKKSNGFIIRKSPNKEESICFGIINYWPLCQKIDYVGFHIRFDNVEKIVIPFLFKYDFFNVKGLKAAITVGDSIFFNEEVNKDSDIDKFIHLHINNIKIKIFDYFTKYNTINQANMLKKKSNFK
jgi:hypothetical protein